MEKERIIELVKQNVLTMDEALELLEAAGHQEIADDMHKNKKANEADYFSEEYQEAMKAEESQMTKEQDDLRDEIKEFSEQKKKQEEALVIVKQRLRELEIFQEIDDLTEEMEVQLKELKEQEAQLTQKIEATTESLNHSQVAYDQIQSEKLNQYSEDVKQFINEHAHSAKRVGKTFANETKTLGQSLKSVVQDLSNSFQMKDTDIGVKVPWLKSIITEKSYEYDVEGLEQISISILNGSAKVNTHDKSTIYAALTIREFGSEGEVLIDEFESLNVIQYQDQAFDMNIKSPKYAVDLDIYIPETMINKLEVKLVHGDLIANNVSTDYFIVKHKNGDIHLNEIQSNSLMIDTFNSDLKIKNSNIEQVKIQNVNGDIRYQGNINHLTINSANSDIFLTKVNPEASNITVKLISGDVKIAIPEQIGLNADVKSSMGEVFSRLTNASIVAKEQRHTVTRDSETSAHVNVSVTTGDVFIKDTDNY